MAAALLLGAPTAGAALRSKAPAPPTLSAGLIHIELVIPPEPEIVPVYPIATLDNPPSNDFKLPAGGSKWGYGFPGFEPVSMWAEPQGASVRLERSDWESVDDENWRRPAEWLQAQNNAPKPIARPQVEPRNEWRPSERSEWRPDRYGLQTAELPAPAPSAEAPSSFAPATGWLDQ